MGHGVKRRRIFFGSLVAILLSATLFVSVGADLNLGAGDNGRVAYTGGDGVNLRATPGGEVITWLGEGYPVIVQDGLWLDDGGLLVQRLGRSRLGLVVGLDSLGLRDG